MSIELFNCSLDPCSNKSDNLEKHLHSKIFCKFLKYLLQFTINIKGESSDKIVLPENILTVRYFQVISNVYLDRHDITPSFLLGISLRLFIGSERCNALFRVDLGCLQAPLFTSCCGMTASAYDDTRT